MNYQKIIEKFGEGRIGDVLEKIIGRWEGYGLNTAEIRLVKLWKPLGFTKSLHDILRDEMRNTGQKECVCGERRYTKSKYAKHCGYMMIEIKELSQTAKELFNFLETL